MTTQKSKKSKAKRSRGKHSKSQKQPTQLDKIKQELLKDLKADTPQTVLEAIAIQVYTAREARKRIDEEGSVVRDSRGSVIAHPAIKIEASAIKLYTSLIEKNQAASDELSEEDKLLSQI